MKKRDHRDFVSVERELTGKEQEEVRKNLEHNHIDFVDNYFSKGANYDAPIKKEEQYREPLLENIPIVKGFVSGQNFHFYCNFCHKFHRHMAFEKGSGRTGREYGHRISHCAEENYSPYKRFGYFLMEYSKKEKNLIKKMLQGEKIFLNQLT